MASALELFDGEHDGHLFRSYHASISLDRIASDLWI
jgi:hypothetical protein